MANHLTPSELADELHMKRQEVIGKCVEMGVPIFKGRIDKSLFRTSLRQFPTQGETRGHPPPEPARGRRPPGDASRIGFSPLWSGEPSRGPWRTCCRGRRRCTAGAEAMRFKEGDAWVSRSFAEVGETVRALSLGLIDLGVGKGDKVSILANTRPEWTYADFAALSAGATVVPIYQTNSPEECQYVLENSDAKVVVVEDDEQMEKIRAVRDRLPLLEHVIRMTGTSDDAISFDELEARGARRDASEWEARWQSVTPEDICTFIYTSGTTGPPKGCVITPRQLPGDARHGQPDQRDRGGRPHLPLPAPRPLLRPADPVRQLRPRHDDRLLGARPAEDHAQPGRAAPDLLPLGAAHLREDLHDRDQRDGQRGRPQEGDLQLVDQGRQAGCARSNARAASRASCCAGSTSSPTRKCSRRSAACSAARSGWRSPARRRSTRTSCASSTPPACSCSRAGG